MIRQKIPMLLILLIALAVPATLFAQIEMNPSLNPMFYTHTLANAKTYAASQTDTLPSVASALTIKAGGASRMSLRFATLDSVNADIYLYYRTIGVTAWTAGITDSLQTGADSLITKSYIVRSVKTDNAGEKLDTEFRVRVAFRATGNGTTTPTYICRFDYTP